jgi:hypothetical protein
MNTPDGPSNEKTFDVEAIGLPGARETIALVGLEVAVDYSGVIDVEAAEDVLSSLVTAAVDLILGTGAHSDNARLEAQTADPEPYRRYPHVTETVAVLASLLGEFICSTVAEAQAVESITGQGIEVCLRALHVVIDSENTPDGVSLRVARLDLDPDDGGGVSIYSSIDPELFGDLATAFALYSHHFITETVVDCGGGYSALLSVID